MIESVYVVGKQGYDGIEIFGIFADYDLAISFMKYKHEEIHFQVDILEYDIMHEY